MWSNFHIIHNCFRVIYKYNDFYISDVTQRKNVKKVVHNDGQVWSIRRGIPGKGKLHKKRRRRRKKMRRRRRKKKKKIYNLIWSGSGHLTFTTHKSIRCSKTLFQHVASQYWLLTTNETPTVIWKAPYFSFPIMRKSLHETSASLAHVTVAPLASIPDDTDSNSFWNKWNPVYPNTAEWLNNITAQYESISESSWTHQ